MYTIYQQTYMMCSCEKHVEASHYIKYEEKCTYATQFQGQMYTIYQQAYMMCSCEKMIGPSTYECYVKK